MNLLVITVWNFIAVTFFIINLNFCMIKSCILPVAVFYEIQKTEKTLLLLTSTLMVQT